MTTGAPVDGGAGRAQRTRLPLAADGCDLWGRCGTCPFPACVHEMGETSVGNALEWALTSVLIARSFAEGLSIDEVAVRTGLSVRSIYRWRAKAAGRDRLRAPQGAGVRRSRVVTMG